MRMALNGLRVAINHKQREEQPNGLVELDGQPVTAIIKSHELISWKLDGTVLD